MTGLLGGGHALCGTRPRRGAEPRLLRAGPGLGGSRPCGRWSALEVPFGEELVHYAVGPASCAVPGVPAGLGALPRRTGGCPWPRWSSRRCGSRATACDAAGARRLPAMLAPVMTMDAGAQIYAPGGRLLAEGDVLEQPGLVAALEALADEGARERLHGLDREALLALMRERGGAVTAADLGPYRAGGRARRGSTTPARACSRAAGCRACRRPSRALPGPCAGVAGRARGRLVEALAAPRRRDGAHDERHGRRRGRQRLRARPRASASARATSCPGSTCT